METKTPQNLTREILASLKTLPRPGAGLPPTSNVVKPSVPQSLPLKSKWQQKWLRASNNQPLKLVHPDFQGAANEAEAFCGRWFNHDESRSLLVLTGNTGCGKSRLAKSILRFSQTAAMAAFDARKWPNHPSAIFLQWPELAVEFAAKNFSAIQDANSSDLLVLDDIGADNDPWSVARDMLCQILSRRERKFTVVTTNIQMQDWAEKFDVRINDRLMRNSIIVDLSNVPSYSNQ